MEANYVQEQRRIKGIVENHHNEFNRLRQEKQERIREALQRKRDEK